MNWPLEDCCFAQLFRILKQLTLFLSFSELVGLSSNFCNPRGGFKAFLSSCWVNRSNTQMNESESKGIFIIRLFGPKKLWPKLMWTVCSSFASVNFTLDNYVSSWQQRVVLKLHRPAYRLHVMHVLDWTRSWHFIKTRSPVFSFEVSKKNQSFEVRGWRTFLPFTHAKSNSVFFDIGYILGHSRNEKRKHLSSD